MDQSGPSPYRPYYTPTTSSYLPGTGAVANSTPSDATYDFIDNTGIPSKEVLIAVLQAQLIEYIGICIAQPFENAKILLQCQMIPKGLKSQSPSTATDDDDDAEEEEEEPDYFSEQPLEAVPERRTTDRKGYVIQNSADDVTRPPWQIGPKVPPTLGNVLDSVWTSEGLSGSFKATNLSFCYNFLREVLEGQISGLLSVLVGIPDPILVLDSGDSMSLLVSVASASIAALVLAPLDIARTKIILTPVSEPRGIIHTLRSLPSALCPKSLIIPTLLERIIPTILQDSLQTLFDPVSSLIELFVRLPLETILHRAQASYSPPKKSIVQLGAYTGIFGTPWWISRQEGDGAFGLYRGWKAGVWGVVGVWTLGLLAAGQERRTGTEF